MKKAVVFIDGAYLESFVQQKFPGKQMNVPGLLPRLEYNTASHFNESYEVIRTYYYDAIPEPDYTQPPAIVQKHEKKRMKKQQFLEYLMDNCSKLDVVKGLVKVKGNGDLEQKGVDVSLGADMALMANQGRVDVIILISGDADFVPAVEVAKRAMVNVYLIAERGTTSKALRRAVDWFSSSLEELVVGNQMIGSNLIHDPKSSVHPDSIPVDLSP